MLEKRGREEERRERGLPCPNHFNVVRDSLHQGDLVEVLLVCLALFKAPEELQQALYADEYDDVEYRTII